MWIEKIYYVDDVLYYSNDDEIRKNFEKKFHLSLREEAKWYLGMRIVQKKNDI